MSDLIPRGRVDAATRSEALAVLHAYADGDLLTRVEAANKMVTFFDHYCDDSPNWPMRDDAMKWLEVTDDE